MLATFSGTVGGQLTQVLLYQVIHKSVKHFKNLQEIRYIISQLLNVSTFGNTEDIYVTVHLVPHACQHITVNCICYCCLLAANQGNYVRGL
jgi:hypothetical protein